MSIDSLKQQQIQEVSFRSLPLVALLGQADETALIPIGIEKTR